MLGWEVGGEAWKWRRGLWVWEEELLKECRLLLLDVSLQTILADVWQWLPDPSRGYTIRGAYDILTSQEAAQIRHDLDLAWHPQVPLEVSIFAWWLLRDRLPTKVDLATRSVLSVDTCFYVSGCGQVEDASHLFISCIFF